MQQAEGISALHPWMQPTARRAYRGKLARLLREQRECLDAFQSLTTDNTMSPATAPGSSFLALVCASRPLHGGYMSRAAAFRQEKST